MNLRHLDFKYRHWYVIVYFLKIYLYDKDIARENFKISNVYFCFKNTIINKTFMQN